LQQHINKLNSHHLQTQVKSDFVGQIKVICVKHRIGLTSYQNSCAYFNLALQIRIYFQQLIPSIAIGLAQTIILAITNKLTMLYFIAKIKLN
jgi:hypothetical protein